MTPSLRVTLTVIGVFGCLLGISSAGKAGLSRFLSETALENKQFDAANEAVWLEPNDPQSHYARGILAIEKRQFDAAIEDFESSIRLRPRDYSAWLQLGLAREAKGDTVPTVEAFGQAVRLAPYYARPRWLLGNSLLVSGRQKEAFVELRFAAQSDPSLLPKVIELAWRSYEGEAGKVLGAIQPQNDFTRGTLASFFVIKGRINEAVQLLREAGKDADWDRYALTVASIEAHRYRDAAEISRTGTGSPVEGQLEDGDFERGVLAEGTGFVWQSRQTEGTTILVDQQIAQHGSKSLSLNFNGAIDSGAVFVKQLVLLAPRTRYQLSFASRTENLVTGGSPLVEVIEGGNGRLLALSDPVTSGVAGWSHSSVEFQTSDHTEAAYITLRSQKCQEAICPIFGRVWFDNFSLKKL